MTLLIITRQCIGPLELLLYSSFALHLFTSFMSIIRFGQLFFDSYMEQEYVENVTYI